MKKIQEFRKEENDGIVVVNPRRKALVKAFVILVAFIIIMAILIALLRNAILEWVQDVMGCTGLGGFDSDILLQSLIP